MAGAERETAWQDGPDEAVPAVPAAGPDVPDAVRSLAAERRLGTPLDVRDEGSAGAALLRGGATAAISVAALVGAGYLGQQVSVFSLTYSLIRLVGLFFLFTCVAGIGFALRGLIVGSRAHYLFTGGLVTARRGGPVAIAWPEVEALETVYNRRSQGNEGKVIGYRVRAANTAVVVPLLRGAAGRDPFLDRVLDEIRALGRPIR